MDMRTKDIEKLSGKVDGLSRLHDCEARENNCHKVDGRLNMAHRGMAAPAFYRGVGVAYAPTPWR